MSETNLNLALTAKLLDQVLLKDCMIKVKLNELISDKIKFLCKEIPKEEWSGVLFYSVEGTIADPRNMVITLEDLFPMNKGTSAFTEYAYSEEVVEFRMDNPKTNYFKVGHIHSHNTMNVFFSGTDTSELSDNVKFHNYYLSVIVNNYFEVEARIAFLGTEEVVAISGKNEDGEDYVLTVGGKREYMFYYKCEIMREAAIVRVDTSFIGRVKHIIAEALKPKTPVVPIDTRQAGSSIAGKTWNYTTQRWEDDVPTGKKATGYWDANRRVWVDTSSQPTKGELWKQWEKERNAGNWENPKIPQRYDTDAIHPRNFPQDEIDPENLVDAIDDDPEADAEFEFDGRLEDMLINVLTAYPDFKNQLEKVPEIITLDDVFIFLEANVRRKMINPYFAWVLENLYEKYGVDFVDQFENSDDQKISFYEDLERMIQIVEEYRFEHRLANKLTMEMVKLQLQMEV